MTTTRGQSVAIESGRSYRVDAGSSIFTRTPAPDARLLAIGEHIGVRGSHAMTNVKFFPYESRPPSFEEGAG